MAREIFISYSRKDLEKVKSIKTELEHAIGTECWMDLEGIESGSIQFPSVIVDSINNCRVFLFMLSINSQSSKYALRELNYAMKKAEVIKQKHVVIVNIDNSQMCDEFDFMYGLVDTISWNDISQHNKLIKDLTKWLEKKEGSSSHACNNAIPQKEIHSYGILMIREDGSSFVWNVIKKTDPLIVERTIKLYGAHKDQTALSIDIYQTDRCEDGVEIDDCIHLCKKELSWGFPVPSGTPLHLFFSRSYDGSIDVSIDCKNKRYTYNII